MKDYNQGESLIEIISPKLIKNPLSVFYISTIGKGIIWAILLFNPWILERNWFDKIRLFQVTFVPFISLLSIHVLVLWIKSNEKKVYIQIHTVVVMCLVACLLFLIFNLRTRSEVLITFYIFFLFLMVYVLNAIYNWIDKKYKPKH